MCFAVKFYCYFIIVFSVFFSLNSYGKNQEYVKTEAVTINPGLTNYENCVACHQSSVDDWKKSDHAKAMATATSKSVLGDFNNQTVEHYGQKALFYREDASYYVKISYGDNTNIYLIQYTFGHFPLQQYLVETEKGRLQVLPFAWDSRTNAQGGQRWYHIYSDEEITPQDRLHWQQPLQNWNGMCADCHSDGLKRQYNSDKNTFSTTWDNINVGCQSCHGKMNDHNSIEDPKQKSDKNNTHSKISNAESTGHWLRKTGDNTASWQGEKRDNRFMDTCFSCHSLRSPLTDGFSAEKPFLDQFIPTLITPPLYYPDGQIKEEVYVYGSFLQSKMYAAGVNCIDCHDKHTMKIKVQGNGLCLQCHANETFDTKEHHLHEQESSGAQCINCHMPSTMYMGADDRADHSFKIPRPDLSLTFNTPNACTKCHDDKTNEWAVSALESAYGKAESASATKLALTKLNHGESIPLEQHLAILSDDTLAVISRATALQQIGLTTKVLTTAVLRRYTTHQEPLIRISAAQAANLLPPNDKVKLLTPLLKDKLKSVRIAAARNLIDTSVIQIDQAAFNSAFKELKYSNDINSWRAEGMLNQGVLHFERKEVAQTEIAFKKAISIDPYFEASYINLANIYRGQQRSALESSVLQQGMKTIPKSGDLTYAFGLYLVRERKLDRALSFFQKSMILTPSNPQYAYTYILALDELGKSAEALKELKGVINDYEEKSSLIEFGLYLSQKLGKRKDYDWFLGL